MIKFNGLVSPRISARATEPFRTAILAAIGCVLIFIWTRSHADCAAAVLVMMLSMLFGSTKGRTQGVASIRWAAKTLVTYMVGQANRADKDVNAHQMYDVFLDVLEEKVSPLVCSTDRVITVTPPGSEHLWRLDCHPDGTFTIWIGDGDLPVSVAWLDANKRLVTARHVPDEVITSLTEKLATPA